jgi:inner membrane protein
MASVLSHAVAAAAIGAALPPRRLPVAVWGLGIVWSIVPDIDVIGFQLGVPYEAALGHRGLTHSLAFAAVIATLAAWLHQSRGVLSRRVCVGAWAYLFLATASHGLLDAMTNGGLGVAFFAPFSNARYFLPWRPIAVSPIGVEAFFSTRGLQILATEIVWIWFPAGVLASTLVLTRRMARGGGSSEGDRSHAFVGRSASWSGIVLSASLAIVLCAGLAGVYAWAGPRSIQENRYASYAETRTPEARWLAFLLPPSATLIHERHATDIDLLYGSFRFDPIDRRDLEPMLTPGFRSNVRIDQDASFPSALPQHPTVEFLRRSGFEVYSKKDFGLAIEWNKGIAFFWYSAP